MENIDFAEIFRQIGELMELKGENPFKVRAYYKAAQNIESLSENVTTIYERGGLNELKEVPGIGEHIAAKIEELIKTGKLRAHDSLMKGFPPHFLDLIDIPGMGPKTTMLLYKKLKVDSIDKLEKAIRSGAVNKLPGMGQKKADNILKGIEQFRARKGRFPISIALSYAETIVNSLKKLKEVDKILICGSLRRMKETIGDIDILVTSRKPEKVMDSFTTLPGVKEIIAKGKTKSAVILRSGIEADVRVVEPASFGAAAHYFTGSKQHNIKIREMGVKKGLKINEYGIFRGNKRIGGEKEEDVFKSVGLPYIPSELRECSGEIEAAEKGKLPKLIELPDIRGDLHSHTKASDGGNTIEELAEEAKGMGYEYLAITDHTISSRIAGGLSEKEALKQIEKIEKAGSKIKGIKLLKGVEVDIHPDGSLDYKDLVLKEFDVVIAAVHSKFTMEKDAMTKRIMAAMENKYVNILAHPTGRLIGKREPYQVDLDKVIAHAKKTGAIIELNAYPARLDLSDIYLRKAKELGVIIAISTDAHTTDQLNNMKYGIAIARWGWLEPKDVLNTLPYASLLKKLHSKR
ncbi:MAG: DNA polymerase/3'-5' exonuclease PolX [Candidatus Saganbacteria bacterium]|nr:DNA polymerase/3'-5' exonuclease PolX [Candidatus Saganbacteria bacterium]